MSFFDYLYPRFCLGCGKFGTYCCRQCVQKIGQLQHFTCPECHKPAIDGQTHPTCKKRYGLDGLLSLFPYAGIVQRAIKETKYRFAYRVITDLLDNTNIDRVIEWTQKLGRDTILIVPIPLHTSRQYIRGFNQSKIIAHCIGKQLNTPIQDTMLVRIKKTLPQVNMKNRSERLRNMRDVFEIGDAHIFKCYSVVLLVDDVCTTGATMRSAAAVIKRSGVPTVWGLTIAQ